MRYTMSAAEWGSRAGTTRFRREHEALRERKGITCVESQLPETGTEGWVEARLSVLDHRTEAYVSPEFGELRLKRRSQRRRAIDQTADEIVGWAAAAFGSAGPEEIQIRWGSGGWSGRHTAPLEAIKEALRERRVRVDEVPEAYTTKLMVVVEGAVERETVRAIKRFRLEPGPTQELTAPRAFRALLKPFPRPTRRGRAGQRRGRSRASRRRRRKKRKVRYRGLLNIRRGPQDPRRARPPSLPQPPQPPSPPSPLDPCPPPLSSRG